MVFSITPEGYPILNDLTANETESLNKLKQNEICKGIPDQHLIMFLLSKKLNIENTLILIQNNLKLRKLLELPIPITKKDVNAELAKKGSSFMISGKTDKQGRIVSYLHPSKLVPKDYPLKDYITFLLWNIDQTVHEHSSLHRNGITIIEDLNKISMFKHIDNRLNEFLKKNGIPELQNVFPGRIQSILLINPPWILKPLLSLGKTFVKSKIISRIQIIKNEDIFKTIDKDQVLVEYGGTLNLQYSDYFDSLPSNY